MNKTAFKLPENIISKYLVKRVLLWATLLSIGLTLIFGFITLNIEIRKFKQQLDEIEKSYIDVLRESLWIDDQDTVNSVLVGINNLPGIRYAGILVQGKIISEYGIRDVSKKLLRVFQIPHQYNDNILILGELHVQGSNSFLRRGLVRTVITITIVQAATIFFVCGLILWLIHKKVIARIIKIKSYTSSLSLNSLDSPLMLAPTVKKPDEIDTLADEINQMRENLYHAHKREKEAKRKLQEAHDILEKKVEERTKELIKTVSELEALFENGQVGIMVLYGGRICVRANQRLADIFGYTNPSEMHGLSMRELHLSEERFHQFGNDYHFQLQNQEMLQIEYQLKRKDGSPVWCTLSGKTLDSKSPPELDLGIIWMVDDISAKKEAENEREQLVVELQEALNNVKTLSGLLPICSHCKKIRDDEGYWKSIELYIYEHSEAEFSHGICQECAKIHYPDMDLYKE